MIKMGFWKTPTCQLDERLGTIKRAAKELPIRYDITDLFLFFTFKDAL